MQRTEFVKLIGTNTLVDYFFYKDLQTWSMENFIYDKETDTISHNRLPLILDAFIPYCFYPRSGDKSNATHG